MKKTFLVLFTTLIGTSSSIGQIEKGTNMIGGRFMLNYKETKDDASSYSKTYDFGTTLNPSIARFIAPNFALGLQFPFTTSVSLYQYRSNGSFSNSFSYGINPFARYYLGANKTKVFFQAGVKYSRNDYVSNLNKEEITFKNRSFNYGGNAGIGIAYFINQHVALEGLLNYSHTRHFARSNNFWSGGCFGNGNHITETKSNNIDFTVGLQIYLGKKRNKIIK